MSQGLLQGAFRPFDEVVCVLRQLMRHREMLLTSQARNYQHMQKALTQMNIQLANVISDEVGETGQNTLRGIVACERDGQVLAALTNARIRASAESFAKSLQGNWRAEHLFAVNRALSLFNSYARQLPECNRETEAQLQSLATRAGSARNAPRFELRERLFPMCGVDLLRIDGIDVTTALAVISGVGANLFRSPTPRPTPIGFGYARERRSAAAS